MTKKIAKNHAPGFDKTRIAAGLIYGWHPEDNK
jgi:hypothetical protein